jgi:hypothetical protein
MPPRPNETATPAAPAPEGQKPAAAPPAAATAPAPAAAPAPAKPAAPPAPPAKPAAAPAKKEEPKQAKPAEQKPAPAAAKQAAPKPAVNAPVKAAEKPAPAKEKQPAAAAAQPAKKEQKAAAAEAKDKEAAKAPVKTYTLVIGEVPVAEAAAVEAKLKAHKVTPVVKHGVQKPRQMTRLFYGSFTGYDSYAAELDKLKKVATGAFAIEKDGRYSLYAGSFGSPSHAAAEKKRLADKGLRVELQQVSLPVSTVKLSAGTFAGKAAADKAAAGLKKAGLVVKVIPKGK